MNTFIFDVMLDGRFVCTLKYDMWDELSVPDETEKCDNQI